MYVSSRTLPRFLSVFLYSTLSFPLSFPGKPSNFPGSEPSLRLICHCALALISRSNVPAKIPGVLRVGFAWKIPGTFAVSSSLPQILPQTSSQYSDSGKLESCQNGAPKTLWFPWKFPETQSAGDPLVSLWVAGNSRTGQLAKHTFLFPLCGGGVPSSHLSISFLLSFLVH